MINLLFYKKLYDVGMARAIPLLLNMSCRSILHNH